jgi:hypothetical protein
MLTPVMDDRPGRNDHYTLNEVSAFAGQIQIRVIRWVERKWITPTKRKRALGHAEYLFTERQARQAFLLGSLLPNGRTPKGSQLTGSQLSQVLRRMPDTEPDVELWLIIERNGPRRSYSWTTEPDVAMQAVLGRANLVDAVTMTNRATGQRVMPARPALKSHQSVSIHSVPHPAVAFCRVVAVPTNDKRRVAARRSSSSVDPGVHTGESILSCEAYPTKQACQHRRRHRAA